MSRARLAWGGLAVAAAIVGVLWNPGAPSSRRTAADRGPEGLTGTLEPLRAHFNDNAHRARLVALVSPNCLSAFYGFRAIERLILDDRELDVAVIVVWTPLLPYDSSDSAAVRHGRIREDPRVHRFWDAEGLAASALARATGVEESPTLEDIYLLFEAGALWQDDVPSPAGWLHQLEGVDSEHRHRGDALEPELGRLLAGVQ